MNENNNITLPKKYSQSLLILIAILALGTFLRLYHLGHESFWLDETLTASLIQKNPAFIIDNRAHTVHPPLFYLFLHYVSIIIGSNEITLRLPSAIFGITSLFVLWKMGKTFFSPSIALLATFFLAISPLHIQFSQEARANSLLLLAILCSYYFLLKLQQEIKITNYLGYFFATSIAIWTHNFGLVYIALQIFLVLIEWLVFKKKDFPWKIWFVILVFVGLSYIPWISIILYQISVVGSGSYWLGFAIWQNLVNSLISFSGSIFGFVFLIPFILYFSVLNLKEEKYRLIFHWSLFSLFLVWGISTFLIPVFLTRNILPSLPAFLLLAAASLAAIKYKPLHAAFILIFSASCVMSLYSYYTVTQKDQWREAAAYVRANMNPQDSIYYEPNFAETGFDWYLKDISIKTTTSPDENAWLLLYGMDEDQVNAIVEQRATTEFYKITIAHPLTDSENTP